MRWHFRYAKEKRGEPSPLPPSILLFLYLGRIGPFLLFFLLVIFKVLSLLLFFFFFFFFVDQQTGDETVRFPRLHTTDQT